MSSIAALLLAVSGPSGPMADGSTIGTSATAACGERARPGDIVVCGRAVAPPPRLPLPDERLEPGETRRFASDGPRGDPGPPREPNRLLSTIITVVRKAANAAAGTDPD